DGAKYFLQILCKQSARAVFAKATPSTYALAAAMYAANYYTGFKVRDQWYEQPDGSKKLGRDLNIDAYAAAVSPLYTQLSAALAGWTPGAAPPPELDVTAALAKLGFADVRAFQKAHPPLAVDGICGPRTTAAIEGALGGMEPTGRASS